MDPNLQYWKSQGKVVNLQHIFGNLATIAYSVPKETFSANVWFKCAFFGSRSSVVYAYGLIFLIQVICSPPT